MRTSKISHTGGIVQYEYEVNRPAGLPPQPPDPARMRMLLGDDFFAAVIAAFEKQAVLPAM